MRLSSTAASGAKASVSSSWKEDASHTTVAAGPTSPASEASAVPTLPATATGRPASRWTWPISSTVVVLPLEPVTARNSLGTSRQAELELAEHGDARRLARGADHRRLLRHPGALDQRAGRGHQLDPLGRRDDLDAERGQLRPHRLAGLAGVAADHRQPERAQRPRGGDARAGEPDDEVRRLGQRRAGDHPWH